MDSEVAARVLRHMPPIRSSYDAVIIGGGHNGLVAAAYLAKAGLSVLLLERTDTLGGATQSQAIFEGLDARLSLYSYLVSLFPSKIMHELGLDLPLKTRATASWTPAIDSRGWRELWMRNDAPETQRQAFIELTGTDQDYRGYLKLQQMQMELASIVWPSLTERLISKEAMRAQLTRTGAPDSWEALIEEPLGKVIETRIHDDLIRGLVFTDAKIGLSTHAHDPTLLQNRCFLYHVIGQGTGEWRVPVGGMGQLVSELQRVIQATGKVTLASHANVTAVAPRQRTSEIAFTLEDKPMETRARFVLCNASSQVLQGLLGPAASPTPPPLEGAACKINLLLERLPRLRSPHRSPEEAFAGTFHIDEGYAQMQESYRESQSGHVPTRPPGEIYCHTLTDPSILSPELQAHGYHTLTLFGLDTPYHLFETHHDARRKEVLAKYLEGINQFLAEPIEECLATDAQGQPCVEAMSPVDLENKLCLPKGNIFHGDLSWPFAESDDEVGTWGVETEHDHVLLCGSAAKRGGAVSGIPGHNAAMKVLEMIGSSA